MPTLLEILAKRKQAEQKEPADTEQGVAEQLPRYTFHQPTNEFYSLFEDCTEF